MYQIVVIWSDGSSGSSTYSFKTEEEALAFKQGLDATADNLNSMPFCISRGNWTTTRSWSIKHIAAISVFVSLWSIMWWYLLTASDQPLEYLAVTIISGSVFYLASLASFWLKKKIL